MFLCGINWIRVDLHEYMTTSVSRCINDYTCSALHTKEYSISEAG
jgi:hypothetical protein